MSLADAKIILNDILDKPFADSILNVYIMRDSLNTSSIILQKEEIKTLKEKGVNLEMIKTNNEKIILNKDKEISDLNDVIKKQKREIFKQKVLKIIGFTAAVALPITTIILMSH